MSRGIQNRLFELQDTKYRDFHGKLIPDISMENIIGIRTPVLRKYAKEIFGTDEAEKFINELPHRYYDENNLHMMLITQIKDYYKCLEEVKKFLPYIDNWATCDLPAPVCFGKHKDELMVEIKQWMASGQTYIIRYGIEILMKFYLDEDFKPEYVKMMSQVQSEEYYVNMIIAWYMATALAKQWDDTIPYLEEHKMSDWVHRKTISKAIDSYRITSEQKEYLRGLR